MNYEVKTLDIFEKQAKRLIKKFTSLKMELLHLIQQLKTNPEQGSPIGRSCHKIRIPIASKGKGKRSGGRLITHVVLKDTIVYLISIYDKSEKITITDKELLALLKFIP